MSKTPNSKDRRYSVPVDLPNVKPEDYAKGIDSGHASSLRSADKKKPDAGPPDYTLPG